jgi:hypothetical protein
MNISRLQTRRALRAENQRVNEVIVGGSHCNDTSTISYLRFAQLIGKMVSVEMNDLDKRDSVMDRSTLGERSTEQVLMYK